LLAGQPDPEPAYHLLAATPLEGLRLFSAATLDEIRVQLRALRADLLPGADSLQVALLQGRLWTIAGGEVPALVSPDGQVIALYDLPTPASATPIASLDAPSDPSA
jgi:hypothetical protein